MRSPLGETVQDLILEVGVGAVICQLMQACGCKNT
jgi:hypothetical protein